MRRSHAWLSASGAAAVLLVPVALVSSAYGVVSASISAGPAGFVASETVKVSVDFPTASPYLTLQSDGGTGVWKTVEKHKKADKNGKKTFSLRVDRAQKVRVLADASTTTTADLQLTPAATKGVLDAVKSNKAGTSASVAAHFSPVRKNQSTQLQALTIETSNTDDVKKPSWRTISSAKQDAKGNVTFTINNPMEVQHQYRAVTGPSGGSVTTVSNLITFAAPAVSRSTGLSTVYFNSNEGHSVNSLTHEYEGEFSMTGSSKIAACTAVKKQPSATMKGRGNYSWTFSKKSFTLKLDKKVDLCGMGKSKKWALISSAYDKSLLRTAAAFNIGATLNNLAWTPKVKPVDLYVNGSYRGSYLLVERITIDEKRINIDELVNGKKDDPTGANNKNPNITGGYVLEWDFRKGADHNVTAGKRGWVGIKEPENEDDGSGITKQQVSYINSYLDATDKALYGKGFGNDTTGWKKYIDEKSAVDYYIAQELMKPVDGNMWASVYMYKARNGKLYFGPMWDYDLAAGSARRAGNTGGSTGWYLRNPVSTTAKQSGTTWFNRLNDDPDFRRAVAQRWKVVYPQLKKNDAFLAGQKAVITSSATANFGKWSVKAHISPAQVVRGSWYAEVSYLRSWLKSRISWMNRQY